MEKNSYHFWDDLKRLGRVAIQFVTITPFDARGYRSNHVRVETEVHPGQLFVGDTIAESGGEALEPIIGYPDDLYAGQDPPINQPYRHPFDYRPTEDTRGL